MTLPRTNLFHSFLARVIGALMLLLIATTMALNWYFSFRAAERLKSNLIHHSQTLVQALARSSRIAFFTGNKDQLTTVASYIATDPECQVVMFFDEQATQMHLYEGRSYQTKVESLTAELFLERINKGDVGDSSKVVEVGSSIVLIEPVLTELAYSTEELFGELDTPSGFAGREQSIIGYVVMTIDSSSVRKEARRQFLRDLSFMAGVTLLASLAVWAVIKHFVAVPLGGLVGEIRRLSGDGTEAGRQRPLDIPSDFSKMIEVIQTSYTTIYELKSSLEEKVAARTRELEISNQDLLAQKTALADANGQLSEALAQLKATQAYMVQSEKMAALGMMISGLSHEIKNSINFIATSVPLLEMTVAAALKDGGECPAAKFNVLLANIREGVDRTVQVINDLSVFCYDGGTVFVSTDILPGLKAAVGIVRREFGKRIVFSEEYAMSLPLINGLSGQLNQVFLNILLNAAQAISGEGEIMVKSWAEDDGVHVSIADSGYGIDEHNIGRIFDPFFTTKEVGKGTGLGLSISYTIIKNHGGKILVSSTKGSGSTFEIVLPVYRGKEDCARLNHAV